VYWNVPSFARVRLAFLKKGRLRDGTHDLPPAQSPPRAVRTAAPCALQSRMSETLHGLGPGIARWGLRPAIAATRVVGSATAQVRAWEDAGRTDGALVIPAAVAAAPGLALPVMPAPFTLAAVVLPSGSAAPATPPPAPERSGVVEMSDDAPCPSRRRSNGSPRRSCAAS
jgi:hypothetical protein